MRPGVLIAGAGLLLATACSTQAALEQPSWSARLTRWRSQPTPASSRRTASISSTGTSYFVSQCAEACLSPLHTHEPHRTGPGQSPSPATRVASGHR